MAAPVPSEQRVMKVFHEIEEKIPEDDWSDPSADERIANISNQILNNSDLNKDEKSKVLDLVNGSKIYSIQGLDEKINEEPLFLHCKDGDVEIPRNMSNRFGLIRTVLENDKEATKINVKIPVQVVKDALELLEFFENPNSMDNLNEIFSNESDYYRKINNFLIAQDYLGGKVEIEVLDRIAAVLNTVKGTFLDLKDSKLLEIWKNFLNLPEAQVPAVTLNIKKMQEIVWNTVYFYMEDYPDPKNYDIEERRMNVKEFLNGFKIIPAVYHSDRPGGDYRSFSDFLKFVDFIKQEGFSNYSADIIFDGNWIESEPTVPKERLVSAVIGKHIFTPATFKILSEDCPRLTHLAFYQSKYSFLDLTSDFISKGFPKLTNLAFYYNEWVTPEILDIILEKCPKLTTLEMSKLDNITDEYITSLKERYPNLEINRT